MEHQSELIHGQPLDRLLPALRRLHQLSHQCCSPGPHIAVTEADMEVIEAAIDDSVAQRLRGLDVSDPTLASIQRALAEEQALLQVIQAVDAAVPGAFANDVRPSRRYRRAPRRRT